VTIRFKLKEFDLSGIMDNETIISGSLSEGFIIEGKYHNEFIAMQRILSFGDNCIVISPENFKENIIDSLKKMRALYDG
jgi:predicted DNA-binding transcriptional regulator YafY